MLLPINEIKVNNRIRKDLGDIHSLAENIKNNGLLNDIIVIKDSHILIAGERRLAALKLIGITQINVKEISIENAESLLELEFSENNERKEFTKEEQINWGIECERIEKIKASERQRTSTGGSKPQLMENFPQAENGAVRDIIAKRLKISGKQYEREKYIVAHKDEVDFEKYRLWNENKISTNKIYTIIKNSQSKEPNEDNHQCTKDANIEYEKRIADLEKTIQDKDAEIAQYKSDANYTFFSTAKNNISRGMDESDAVYNMGRSVYNLLKEELAPLKYSREMDLAKRNETVRENMLDLVDSVNQWCMEMYSMLKNKEQDVIDII